MKLTIVIPALNEEKAIGSIIERTLSARQHIIANSPVSEVEVIVISDGSTDRTAEIASSYDEIGLIVFEQNRGYGAAIKRGFDESSGDLVSFLDADGTCDPNFFAVLCKELVQEHAAVALGSRLGADSKMPSVRRLGNRFYAMVLSILSNRVVTDTASGMRVIRRDILNQLYPLPDGLNFTPAMSARVLMDDRLTIVECPMQYDERIGESKLHVIRDGFGFLRTICEMTFMWRPAKLLITAAIACFALMLVLSAHPFELWCRVGTLKEDMIFRLLFCSLMGTVGFSFLSAGVICDNLHRLWQGNNQPRSFSLAILDRCYSFLGYILLWIPVMPILVWLVGRGVWTRLLHGYVDLHWSRVVLAGLIVFGMLQMLITVQVVNLIRFHIDRRLSRLTRCRPTIIRKQVEPALASTSEVIANHPPEMEPAEVDTSEAHETLVPQSQ